ncbi:MAG: hypothetical protein KH354_00830 [Clostridiales bacterium]|nr:hypothetical protein [Clostridiales bacterium]
MRADLSSNADFSMTMSSQAASFTVSELTSGAAYIPPATSEILGGVKVGDGLKITQEGMLSVDTATQAEQDNTRPITSAAVYTEIGNINSLLETI